MASLPVKLQAELLGEVKVSYDKRGKYSVNYNVCKHLLNYERESYAEEPGNTGLNDDSLIDCSLGINPFGYPGLIDEVKEIFFGKYINKYPEVLYSELKSAIIKYWEEAAELKASNIRIGNGSMPILERINKMFIDGESRVLGYCPQFSDFMVDVQCRGGRYDYVLLKPENNYMFDSSELISAIRPEHKLVYIDNPNNPTGQVIPISVISSIIEEAQKMRICVIVDEAYGDFMAKENSAVSLINKYDNLLVTRTFSKGFGLAGVRVGYLAAGEEISKYYSKVDIPFTVASPAQYLASVALRDKNFLKDCRNKIETAKRALMESCSKIKVLHTDLEVPIMTLAHPDKNVDLYKEFALRHVLTESGKYFIGLGKNYIRFRIPADINSVISVVKDVEESC